jgi:hypothetical protein
VQAHLFAHWKAGEHDAEKKQLLQQAANFDKQYPGPRSLRAAPSPSIGL